ncbi:metallophosphoesterase family protein [Desulfogranum japonicum]|uniref:metallophosphoesterase family protein n=1 Tax=Desulfogranum japonicum TaxID=231447 RepID=UPI000406C273|nr:YfcE family phosphodiesterase [Desulfogranum japonicum]
MKLRIGILSDTHLSRPDSLFLKKIRHCFKDCSVIVHAGDLTDTSLLDAFTGKDLYAVHGNMCSRELHTRLQRTLSFSLGNFTFGLTHGDGLGYDIEAGLWDLFPDADCVIYGHTHRPVCHTVAGRLIVNPGSFRDTGQFGAKGTYAIVEITESLHGKIFEVPNQI